MASGAEEDVCLSRRRCQSGLAPQGSTAWDRVQAFLEGVLRKAWTRHMESEVRCVNQGM